MDTGVDKTMGQEGSEMGVCSPPSRKGCAGTVDIDRKNTTIHRVAWVGRPVSIPSSHWFDCEFFTYRFRQNFPPHKTTSQMISVLCVSVSFETQT